MISKGPQIFIYDMSELLTSTTVTDVNEIPNLFPNPTTGVIFIENLELESAVLYSPIGFGGSITMEGVPTSPSSYLFMPKGRETFGGSITMEGVLTSLSSFLFMPRGRETFGDSIAMEDVLTSLSSFLFVPRGQETFGGSIIMEGVPTAPSSFLFMPRGRKTFGDSLTVEGLRPLHLIVSNS